MFHVKHQQKQKAKCFTWNIKKSRKKNASCETPAKADGKMFHVKHQQKQKAKCFTWNIKSTGRGVFHVKHERKSCRKRNDSMFFVQS